MRIHRLKLKKLNNTRDLGGFPAAGGKHIKYGKLIRSGKLYGLPKCTLRKLGEMHVSTVVDMRIERERLDYPDEEIPGAETVLLPLVLTEAAGISYTKSLTKVWRNESKRIKSEFGTADEYMKDAYRHILFDEQSRETLKKFFELVRKNESCILWHCNAGKDRTGLAAMLLESVLGVDEKLIVEDYAASNIFQRRKRNAQKFGLMIAPLEHSFKSILYALMVAKPEYIMHAIDLLKERCGGVVEYCKQYLGLTDGDIKLLKDKYLE